MFVSLFSTCEDRAATNILCENRLLATIRALKGIVCKKFVMLISVLLIN